MSDRTQRFLEAVREGDFAGARQTLAKGGDVNAQDQRGWTALHHVVQQGDSRDHEIMIERLCGSSRTNPNIRDTQGRTPVHIWAEQHSSPDMLHRLTYAGANVNIQDKAGRTPIFAALTVKTPEALRTLDALATNGANLDIRDGRGDTPLSYAVKYGRAEHVQALIRHGATPSGLLLHAALESRHDVQAKVAALANTGINLDATDANGETALHIAVRNRDTMATESLLACGANPNLADSRGMTPLQIAVAGHDRRRELAQALMRHGADPDHRDGGWSARQRDTQMIGTLDRPTAVTLPRRAMHLVADGLQHIAQLPAALRDRILAAAAGHAENTETKTAETARKNIERYDELNKAAVNTNTPRPSTATTFKR